MKYVIYGLVVMAAAVYVFGRYFSQAKKYDEILRGAIPRGWLV